MDPRIVRGLMLVATVAIYMVADYASPETSEIVKQLAGVMLGWATLKRPGDAA